MMIIIIIISFEVASCFLFPSIRCKIVSSAPLSHRGRQCIDRLILKLAAGGSEWSLSCREFFNPVEKSVCYSLNTWLSGLQGRSERFGGGIFFPLVGIRTAIPRTFVPLRSHYND
jgi:hypothetical protein